MPDYSKTIIYKLWSDNLPHDKIYYGHTTTSLKKRLTRHEKKMNCASRQIIKAGSYHIEELEKWPCKNKKEALWRERWWIENNTHINKNIPIRNEEETIEIRRLYQKNLRRENPTVVSQYNRNRKATKEEVKARNDAYRLANIEKIKTCEKQRVQCARCGAFGGRGNKSIHTKLCYTRFCKAFDIDADFKGIKGGVASE
jgi:hypothetical protein